MNSKLVLFLISLTTLALIFNCKEDPYVTQKDAALKFSVDTVMFDTVFSSVASVTKRFKAFNPYDKTVKISKIFIAKGNQSNYRINVNGQMSRTITDIELAPKDSIFIFVEVTVDPQNSNSPMIVNDSIVFITNGNIQDVNLVSFGQDVNLLNATTLTNDTVWTSNKPFLVYNSVLVDEGVHLTINEGVQLHFHNESSFLVAGTLTAQGTAENPIVFQGDRLEQDYDEIPGQWGDYIELESGGIYLLGAVHFLPGSKDNLMDYTIVKNAKIGVRVDTLASLLLPTLTIKNSIVKNMNVAALYGVGSTIRAENCVFANSGQFVTALSIGGSYEFYHCTFANYWSYSSRQTPALLLNNYYQDVNGVYQVRPLSKAYFGNCIIYGSNETEIALDAFPQGGDFEYQFDNCLMKLADDYEYPDANRFINVTKNQSPEFVDTYDENIFELDTLSPAMNAGSVGIANEVPLDYYGNSRLSDSGPDLGAFERQE